MELPKIMVAPNGARKTKADHPALPVTIAETVETAKQCYGAGAGAIHAHVRGRNQQHSLDAGLYRELIAEMEKSVPQMGVQITTELVGLYSASHIRKLVGEVKPAMVSVGMEEMLSDGDEVAAQRFYREAYETNICVQHILYSPLELEAFLTREKNGYFGARDHQLLFVLGRYTENQQSDPRVLDDFVDLLKQSDIQADWAMCAFGPQESECARRAYSLGGKARIGFENSFWNEDGSIAKNNAERIAEVVQLIND